MITDPKDTLAYHQSRMLSQHRDMSAVPCNLVAAQLSKYKAADNASDTKPEAEALWFYGLNHAVALVSAKRAALEPLPSAELVIVESYYSAMPEKAVRAFYYLLLCCIREARHSHSKDADKSKIEAKFGSAIASFFCSGSGGEESIHQKFMNNPPSASIGDMTGALVWQFYNSSWGGGYGGKAWGSIADCLHRFVTGEYSAEMMLDTVWTLSHNNGPVFNKGHFYGMYSSTLKRLLDVQRSGQIPEAILYDTEISKFASTYLTMKMQDVKKLFQGSIGDYVDWFVVEALGSVQKYPAAKDAQTKKYGVSEKASAAQKAAQELKAAKLKAEKEAAEKHAKEYFTILPNMEVKKVELIREAAAA